MSAIRRLSVSLTGLALLVAATLPAMGSAADLAPLFGADLDQEQATSLAAVDSAEPDASEPDASELECMAKVVMHEAANQPYEGKVAVAQTLVNRVAAGRFGNNVCAVVNQRGQFFNTAAYNPAHDSDNWISAMRVAHAVLTGDAETTAPGAMFFRAAYSPASSFFRSRQRVASIGAHVFYR